MKRLSTSLICVLVGLFAARSDAAIKITKKPVEVIHKEFDPAHKPADMPELHGNEIAVCGSVFDSAVRLAFRPSSRKLPNGTYKGAMVVDDVTVELSVKITVWTPKNATEKVKAHEEGHRQITEKIYKEVADRAAKVAADKIDGRRFEGEGATVKEAEDAANVALTEAHTAMIKAYLAETSVAGQKVQVYYDEITRNGRNIELLEGEAIRKAWEKYPPPLWVAPKGAATRPTTAPATRPAAKSEIRSPKSE